MDDDTHRRLYADRAADKEIAELKIQVEKLDLTVQHQSETLAAAADRLDSLYEVLIRPPDVIKILTVGFIILGFLGGVTAYVLGIVDDRIEVYADRVKKVEERLETRNESN